MEKEARDFVLEIIKGAINELAFEELAKMPEKIAQKQKEIKQSKSQRSQQVDDDLFYGGSDKNAVYKKLNIREGQEKINVSQSEIDGFKNDLISHLQGYSVKLTETIIGDKNSIVSFPLNNGTLDAVVKGTIDGDVEFLMSLTDGLKIKAKSAKITEKNKNLLSVLYNLYNKVFKQKFSEIISPKDDVNSSETDEMTPPPTANAAQQQPPAPAPAV